MKGSGDHYITLPFNNNAIVNLIMGISSLGVEDIEEFYNSPDGRVPCPRSSSASGDGW